MAEREAEAAVADTLRKLAVVFADFEQRLEATPLIRKLTRGRFEVADYHAFLINLRQQVSVRGVGHVDFVIGGSLVIEVDGRAFHIDRFEEDRQRDALLSIRGYRVLRFSYRQVFERWGEVKGAILAAIARGDHL